MITIEYQEIMNEKASVEKTSQEAETKYVFGDSKEDKERR